MGVLSWIVVGLIAGWLAGQVMRGGGYGLIGDIIVGVVGGLLGGWIATSLLHIGAGVDGINRVNPGGVLRGCGLARRSAFIRWWPEKYFTVRRHNLRGTVVP